MCGINQFFKSYLLIFNSQLANGTVRQEDAWWEGDLQNLHQSPNGCTMTDHEDWISWIAFRDRENRFFDTTSNCSNILASKWNQEVFERAGTWTVLGKQFFLSGFKNPEVHLLEPLELLVGSIRN